MLFLLLVILLCITGWMSLVFGAYNLLIDNQSIDTHLTLYIGILLVIFQWWIFCGEGCG